MKKNLCFLACFCVIFMLSACPEAGIKDDAIIGIWDLFSQTYSGTTTYASDAESAKIEFSKNTCVIIHMSYDVVDDIMYCSWIKSDDIYIITGEDLTFSGQIQSDGSTLILGDGDDLTLVLHKR